MPEVFADRLTPEEAEALEYIQQNLPQYIFPQFGQRNQINPDKLDPQAMAIWEIELLETSLTISMIQKIHRIM